jgi:hypothetical protein
MLVFDIETIKPTPMPKEKAQVNSPRIYTKD